MAIFARRLRPRDRGVRVTIERYRAAVRIETIERWTVHEPVTHRERRRGLLGRDHIGPHDGLRLRNCRSVHTFGMCFAIDVVLLDRAGRPLRVHHLPPGRLLLPRRGVRHIVEVGDGRGEAFRALLATGSSDG